jgi:hypothetical protein
MKHDESKLPNWVQNKLRSLKQTIVAKDEEMNRLRLAHDVLVNRKHWFTIMGPPDNSVRNGCYKLFYLSDDGAHPACSLYVGDILVVGRSE